MSIGTPLTAGYVLLSVRTNDVHSVCKDLLDMDGVILAHPLIGPDDIICFIDTQEPDRFRVVLDKSVRSLVDVGTVEHTETMFILADEGHTYSGEEAGSMQELMNILDNKIRHVSGIKKTDTRLVLMDLPREKPDRDREKQKHLGTRG